MFFDINAMYPSTFRDDMPTGRGFEWTMKNGRLTKTLMTNKKISMESIQWLGYMQNDSRFISKNGERCRIISGWDSEEVLIGRFSLDGYCVVDDIKYALEYDGCAWHGCKRCGKEAMTTEVILINS